MEENKEVGHGKVWEWPTMVEKNCEDRGTMEIVCLLYLSFNSDAKLPQFWGATLSRKYELGRIKKFYWFNLFTHAGLKICVPVVRNFKNKNNY